MIYLFYFVLAVVTLDYLHSLACFVYSIVRGE
jgi:hypothetical protein